MITPDASPAFPSREECVLPEMLAARAAATPDRPFALFDEETWSYAQAATEAWRSAHALQSVGVEMGDDNTIVGDVPVKTMGSGNTIVGATDGRGISHAPGHRSDPQVLLLCKGQAKTFSFDVGRDGPINAIDAATLSKSSAESARSYPR